MPRAVLPQAAAGPDKGVEVPRTISVSVRPGTRGWAGATTAVVTRTARMAATTILALIVDSPCARARFASSASLEGGGALLPERAEPLAVVLALEAERLHVGLVLEVGREVSREALVERTFGMAQCARRPRREPFHDPVGHLVELRRRDGAVDEPDALGLGGDDGLAEEKQFDRLRHADQARQEVAHTGVGPAQADAREHEAEAGVVAGGPEVARHDDAERAPERVPLHLRHGRQRQLAQPARDFAVDPDAVVDGGRARGHLVHR